METKKKNIRRGLLALVCLLAVLSAGWLLYKRMEGAKPVIMLDLSAPYLNASQTLALDVSDQGCGLRRVWVGLLKDAQEVVLLEKDLPAAGIFSGGAEFKKTFQIKIEPRKLGITDGKAILRMVARDFSWRSWMHGNRTYIEKEVLIDTVTPNVNILTGAHNISQGGAGLIIYRMSEPCPKNGVQVGENFFPGYSGYFEDPGIMIALFALDYKQGPETQMFVEATDPAGNSVRAGFPHYLKSSVFKKDSINVSDRFLNWKMPEFAVEVPPDSQTPMLDKFLKVNRELRRDNYLVIKGIVAKTANDIYWQGAFLRLPKSARKADFADHRSYKYKGAFIDQQVHLGIDLASVSHSPVPAANSGRVVFAGTLGIYGKTIVIDHGFDLFSMYSHLSSFGVQKGQEVTKGVIIGRTGTTGLAAGDHLHFSMLVHETFVNPVEWWDASWINNNITSKINAVKASAKKRLSE